MVSKACHYFDPQAFFWVFWPFFGGLLPPLTGENTPAAEVRATLFSGDVPWCGEAFVPTAVPPVLCRPVTDGVHAQVRIHPLPGLAVRTARVAPGGPRGPPLEWRGGSLPMFEAGHQGAMACGWCAPGVCVHRVVGRACFGSPLLCTTGSQCRGAEPCFIPFLPRTMPCGTALTNNIKWLPSQVAYGTKMRVCALLSPLLGWLSVILAAGELEGRSTGHP